MTRPAETEPWGRLRREVIAARRRLVFFEGKPDHEDMVQALAPAFELIEATPPHATIPQEDADAINEALDQFRMLCERAKERAKDAASTIKEWQNKVDDAQCKLAEYKGTPEYAAMAQALVQARAPIYPPLPPLRLPPLRQLGPLPPPTMLTDADTDRINSALKAFYALTTQAAVRANEDKYLAPRRRGGQTRAKDVAKEKRERDDKIMADYERDPEKHTFAGRKGEAREYKIGATRIRQILLEKKKAEPR